MSAVTDQRVQDLSTLGIEDAKAKLVRQFFIRLEQQTEEEKEKKNF